MRDYPEIRLDGASRGATLVLVLLVMLGISALSVMALNSVSRSVEHSGVFRVRTQASQLSSSAMLMTTNIAPSLTQFKTQRDTSGSGTGSPLADSDKVIKLVHIGAGSLADTPIQTSGSSPYATDINDQYFEDILGSGAGGTGGLLSDPSTGSRSFTDSLSSYNFGLGVELQQPIRCGKGDAEDKNCVRMVVYSRGQLGKFADSWTNTQQQVGVGRHVVEMNVRDMSKEN